MRILKYSTVLLYLFFGFGILFAAGESYSLKDFRQISAMAARVLDRNHYSAQKMSPELSARIFDGFIDALDPSRMIFDDKDIAGFAAEKKDIGQRLQKGDCELAFRVYELYRRRFAEFREFTRKLLAEKIDFTVDEEFTVDRSKLPRPADEAARHEVWRQKIKNDLLFFRLMERSEKEAQSKDPAREASKLPPPPERILQRQRDMGNDIDQKDQIDILGILLNSMAQAYGAHSNYQPPKLSEDFELNMSLSLSGIGATLTSENGYIKIVELVPGGPAEQSGQLKVNDRLVSVTQENGDRIDLIDMPVSKAVQFIRGPKGTKLSLDVLSGEGAAAHVTRVTLVRDKINLSAGAAKGEVREVVQDKRKIKVGLLTLPSFYMDFDGVNRGDAKARRASDDVKAILTDFRKAGVDSVVVDLRRNGGGSLPDAILLTGLFLPGGPVVQVRTSRSLDLESDEDAAIAYSGPLVLLTSKMSASAAEIFSAALKDAGRAVLVGDSRTFGKGTVLRVESLDRFNGLFSTVPRPKGTLTFEMAMFYRTAGGSVQQLGISPDIRLPSLTEEMKIGEMFMDNHLPWDDIDPVIAAPFDPALKDKCAELRKLSEKRIASDPRYMQLVKEIELYKKIRDRKTVSLNENKRWEEFCREKAVTEETEALLNDPAAGKDKKKGSSDPVLDEALNIAADLFVLGNAGK